MIHSGMLPRYLGLNTFRVLSITTLASVFASSIVVMISDANAICREMNTRGGPGVNETNNKRAYIPLSTVPFQPGGPFFAILSRLLLVCQCLILIFAELGWPKEQFVKFLPVLGPGYGVGIFGLVQVLLSAFILSHRIPKFALVPALLLFTIGCLNIILGLIFRQNIHSCRTRNMDGHNNSGTKETQLPNRRMSFRPGSGRSMTQSSSIGAAIHTYMEKPPFHENWHGSNIDDYSNRMVTLRYEVPPQRINDLTTGFDRRSQEGTKQEGQSIISPERAQPKY